MPRVSRIRVKHFSIQGRINKSTNSDESGFTGWQTVTANFSHTCTDYVGGPVVDSPFTLDKNLVSVVINGDVRGSLNRLERFEDVPVTGWDYEGNPSSTPLPPPNGWGLDLVAGTNPSRPMVTPPTMLQDLIDLPRQLRQLGSFLSKPHGVIVPREGANQYLSWKFGWLPLFDDLHKLLNLQEHIAKRNKELNQLYSGKGLRRRLKFGEETKTHRCRATFPLQGSGANIFVVEGSYTTSKTSWGTIRWKPTSPPPYHPHDLRWNQLTRQILLGFTPEGMAKGLWDVIPWTWLLGWFTNVGKYALLHSNTVPATHSNRCFMSQTIATLVPGSVIIAPPVSGKIVATGVTTRVRKTRAVDSTLLPGLNMPYLDMSRLSVLGALAIQRLRR